MSYQTQDFVIYDNWTAGRPYGIDNITIHHVAGNAPAWAIANTLNNRGVSAHYCIGNDGIVGTLVEEQHRAWHAGDGIGYNSKGNDRGIGIEVTNDEVGGNWHVADSTFEILVELCHDIAVRNGLLPLKRGTTLMAHCELSATSCPGPYLYAKLDELCDRVNNFGKAKEEPKVEPVKEPEPVVEPKEEPKKEEEPVEEPKQDPGIITYPTEISAEGAGVIADNYKKAEEIKENTFTMHLPHKLYEFLRWLLWIVIPATDILLTTLVKAWSWNIPLEPILITLSAVALFLGTILGIAKVSNDK